MLLSDILTRWRAIEEREAELQNSEQAFKESLGVEHLTITVEFLRAENQKLTTLLDRMRSKYEIELKTARAESRAHGIIVAELQDRQAYRI